MQRAIIHLNITGFAASIERLHNSQLRHRPVVIIQEKDRRPLISALSDEAYQAGVRKGMPLALARRYCRGLTALPPNPRRYQQAMAFLHRQAAPFSPLVELTDCNGHLYIDATGSSRLFGPPQDIAWRLSNILQREWKLRPVWSLATNKLVAKVANRAIRPTGEEIVAAGDETAYLRPLPLTMLPGLHNDEQHLLAEFNISRIGELAALSRLELAVPFPHRAHLLHDLARGIDNSPVLPSGALPPMICRQHTLDTASNDRDLGQRVLARLCSELGTELRRRFKAAARLGLHLVYSDGRATQRTCRLKPPSANDAVLLQHGKILLHQTWSRRIRVRHIILTAPLTCTPPPRQLSLFDRPDPSRGRRARNRLRAMDAIRHRFGTTGINTARERLTVTQ